MGFVAENAVDDTLTGSGGGLIHVNLEINRSCGFATPAGCGDRCILVARNDPDAPPMAESEIYRAATEIIQAGSSVRNFAIPAMEPTDSEEVLFKILRRYHEQPESDRPGTIGIISTGLRFPQLLPRFQQWPLSWVIISLDVEAAGLHPMSILNPAMRNAVMLRDGRGCGSVAANTVLDGPIKPIIEIGKRAQDATIDQWYLGPLLINRGNRMVRKTSAQQMIDGAHAVARAIGDGPMRVLVDVGYEAWARIAGQAQLQSMRDAWRLEYPVPGTNVRLIAFNDRARFVRLRWDGELMTRRDLFVRGLEAGSYGRYSTGALTKVLQQLQTDGALTETAA